MYQVLFFIWNQNCYSRAPTKQKKFSVLNLIIMIFAEILKYTVQFLYFPWIGIDSNEIELWRIPCWQVLWVQRWIWHSINGSQPLLKSDSSFHIWALPILVHSFLYCQGTIFKIHMSRNHASFHTTPSRDHTYEESP